MVQDIADAERYLLGRWADAGIPGLEALADADHLRTWAMTRAEWQACDSPPVMLQHLQCWASDRRLRLFGITWERVREIAEIVLHGEG